MTHIWIESDHRHCVCLIGILVFILAASDLSDYNFILIGNWIRLDFSFFDKMKNIWNRTSNKIE